jgi:hypothetical protein
MSNAVPHNLVYATINTNCSAPIPVFIPLDCVLTTWKKCVQLKTLLKLNAWQIVAKCCNVGSVDVYVSVKINNQGVPLVDICAWHATCLNKTIVGTMTMTINDFIRDACSYHRDVIPIGHSAVNTIRKEGP